MVADMNKYIFTLHSFSVYRFYMAGRNYMYIVTQFNELHVHDLQE